MSATPFTAQPLPTGIYWNECVIARSSGRNSITFVKSKDGTIYSVSPRGICVLGSFACNDLDRSAAEVSGAHSVAMVSGIGGRARASVGSAIVLCNRDEYGALRHIRAAIAGADGVKPDTWYSLDERGEFVEVSP